MAIREVRIEGDPLLRKKSREIDEINDRILVLLEDMIDTMYEKDGIGLAAPQVGVLRRAVVIDMRDDTGVFRMINPVIVEKSETGQINVEGCLSVPERQGYEERPEYVLVEYTDEKGEKKKIKAEGYFATCICHELDHLDGVLYIDREIELTQEQIDELGKSMDEE